MADTARKSACATVGVRHSMSVRHQHDQSVRT